MNIDASDSPRPCGGDPVLTSGRFEGRQAFQQLVRDALVVAAREGWREITVSDPTFEDWPLGEREVAESLKAWARPGRKWVMLAGSYDEIVRRHARFVSWRKTWSHLIECRSSRAADPDTLPSCLIGPSWVMRRLDLTHCNGISGAEPQRRVALNEAMSEWLRHSSPAFPASVLGL